MQDIVYWDHRFCLNFQFEDTPPSIAFNFTVVFENEFEAANTGIENIKHAIKHTAIDVKALFLIVFIKNPP